MEHVELDGSHWITESDFYDALLPAIDAPTWHGRNLDALNDTIRGDDINNLRQPYVIHIRGMGAMGPLAKRIVERFRGLVSVRKAEGTAIDLFTD
jgi:RNAse (barnase) inhibitor barstar